MWSRVVALILAGAGCGRLGFDHADRLGDAPVGDARSSDAMADASGDAAPRVIAFTQTNAATLQKAATQFTIALPNDAVAGDLVIVMFDVDYATVRPVGTISDTLGDVFSIAVPDDDEANYVQVMAYTFARAAGPETVTLTLSSTTRTFIDLRAIEYSGISPVDPVDTTSVFVVNPGTIGMVTGPSVTTTGSNELVVVNAVGHPGMVTAGTGFDERSTATGDVIEDAILPIATTIPIRVQSNVNGGLWTSMTAVFR